MLALFEGVTHWRTVSRWSIDVKAASSDWTRVTRTLIDLASWSNWALAAVGSAGLARNVKACVKTASTLPWWEATVFSVWLALEVWPDATAGMTPTNRTRSTSTATRPKPRRLAPLAIRAWYCRRTGGNATGSVTVWPKGWHVVPAPATGCPCAGYGA